MGSSLGRSDILDGLRDLIAELHAAGEVAGIRLVGGAALVLRYFDRRTTADLDSLHVDPGNDAAVLTAARKVALPGCSGAARPSPLVRGDGG